MSKCKKCNIEILDNTDVCPFCNCVVENNDDIEPTYPDAAARVRKFRFLENLLLFISIVVESILIFINYITFSGLAWSILAGLIIVYANVVLRLAILGRSGYMFKIIFLVLFAVGILVGIDFITGYRKWSLDYVLPSGILLLNFGTILLMIINWRNWQSYMMLEIFTILLSLIPIALLIADVIQFVPLCVLAFATSVFIFLGTLILGDQRARTELKRRFYI